MVLNAESLVLGTGYPFHSTVENVPMGNLQRGGFQTGSIYGVGVILGGDFDFPGLEIPNRVVSTPVTEFQFVGFGTVGQG